MSPEHLALLRRLLVETRIATLALPVDDEIVVGVMPFLAAGDLRSLAVHASRLAKHSRGLRAGARFSLAIHEPDRPDADPLAIPRLLVAGTIEAVPAGERSRLESTWIERFPSAVLTVGLGDFDFHRLRLANGRLIAGFAQAFAVGARQLDDASRLGSSGSSPVGPRS